MTGEELRNWRWRLGYTQQQAAKLLGRSRVMISHLEGDLFPIKEHIVSLCDQIEEQRRLQDMLKKGQQT